jgi:sugar phosphate isomerase/epimerase
MFVEGICALPRDRADLDRFEAELLTARRAGAGVVRVVMLPGRRYERFSSREEYLEWTARGVASLELAAKAAARRGVRLALENHKDQRVEERLEVLARVDAAHVGACVDTGNSFALLEDPVEVVRAFASRAFSVHLKDQAVREHENGFLFADAALGDGFLDLEEMVRILRGARPDVRFSLETITRDPLEVPCLTEGYWASFGDVPAADLARTLRLVRTHAATGLLSVSGLSLEAQVRLEEDVVTRSLAFARDRLDL